MKKHLVIGLFLCLCILAGINLAFSQTLPPRTVGILIIHTKKIWEDGKPITDPISYNVYSGVCGGAKTKALSLISTLTGQVPNVTPGMCFTATVVVGTSESAPTAEFVYHGSPGSADGVTVTIVITVVGP